MTVAGVVSIIMPIGFDDPRRERIQHWTEDRWRRLFPHWEFCVGTSHPAEYDRSRARNDAVAASSGDVLILTDADTACNTDVVQRAVEAVRRGVAPWVVAHTSYYSLTEEWTDELLDKPPDIYLPHPQLGQYNWVMRTKSQAGVLVIPREAYDKVNGYDERFKGWGYEDNHFALKLDRLWGRHQRERGEMLHLWHDPGENFAQPHIAHNEKLFKDARDAI